MAELTTLCRCANCGQGYGIDPGVCGICSGNEFLMEGEEHNPPNQDAVADDLVVAPLAPSTSSFRCANCGQGYGIDPGVCGICSGNEFVRDGEEHTRLAEEKVAVAQSMAPPAPSEFVLCTRPDCGQLVPVGQSHCDYCGEPVPLSQPVAPARSFEGGSRPVAWLVAPDGTQVPLGDGVPVVFGRSPDESPWARLAEDNLHVSRRHAEIVVSQGILHVRDLCSTNGTWLGGIRIEGAGVTQLNDDIRIGLSRHLELIVRLA